MADEPKKDHPEDIESILSDLDAILTDMGGEAPAAPKTAEPPKAAPVEVPKPVEPPKPVEAAKPPTIELAPREGMIKPPEKKPEPPKPAAKLPVQAGIELSAGPSIPPPPAPPAIDPPKANPPPPPPPPPVEPPKPAPAPAEAAKPAPPAASAPLVAKTPEPATPAPAAADVKSDEPPADAPKEQIRRVAYIYTPSCSEVKTTFAAFLSQASRTISKKPLFLRQVMSLEVGPASDPNAVVQKAQQAKAVAILAVVEDWPAAKADDLSEACSRANLLFRAVAPADAQKKSTAVDVIVDMMLLPGEG